MSWFDIWSELHTSSQHLASNLQEIGQPVLSPFITSGFWCHLWQREAIMMVENQPKDHLDLTKVRKKQVQRKSHLLRITFHMSP